MTATWYSRMKTGITVMAILCDVLCDTRNRNFSVWHRKLKKIRTFRTAFRGRGQKPIGCSLKLYSCANGCPGMYHKNSKLTEQALPSTSYSRPHSELLKGTMHLISILTFYDSDGFKAIFYVFGEKLTNTFAISSLFDQF